MVWAAGDKNRNVGDRYAAIHAPHGGLPELVDGRTTHDSNASKSGDGWSPSPLCGLSAKRIIACLHSHPARCQMIFWQLRCAQP